MVGNCNERILRHDDERIPVDFDRLSCYGGDALYLLNVCLQLEP